MFKEYDVVQSKKRLSERVDLGCVGTIVMCYGKNKHGEQAYEIEFVDLNSITIDILTVIEKDIFNYGDIA